MKRGRGGRSGGGEKNYRPVFSLLEETVQGDSPCDGKIRGSRRGRLLRGLLGGGRRRGGGGRNGRVGLRGRGGDGGGGGGVSGALRPRPRGGSLLVDVEDLFLVGEPPAGHGHHFPGHVSGEILDDHHLPSVENRQLGARNLPATGEDFKRKVRIIAFVTDTRALWFTLGLAAEETHLLGSGLLSDWRKPKPERWGKIIEGFGLFSQSETVPLSAGEVSSIPGNRFMVLGVSG